MIKHGKTYTYRLGVKTKMFGAFSANMFAGHQIDPTMLGKTFGKGEAILLPLASGPC